jgi:hypothetical protein
MSVKTGQAQIDVKIQVKDLDKESRELAKVDRVPLVLAAFWAVAGVAIGIASPWLVPFLAALLS